MHFRGEDETVTIDWDDASVRVILDCLDGHQAWELLLAYVAPYRGRRIELRDAIWARRREAMPQRGGRRKPRRLRAPSSSPKPDRLAPPRSPVSDLPAFEDIRKELARRSPSQRKNVDAQGVPSAIPPAVRDDAPTHPSRWHGVFGVSGPQPGDCCAECLGCDWWISGSLGGCWACHPPPPGWGVTRFST